EAPAGVPAVENDLNRLASASSVARVVTSSEIPTTPARRFLTVQHRPIQSIQRTIDQSQRASSDFDFLQSRRRKSEELLLLGGLDSDEIWRSADTLQECERGGSQEQEHGEAMISAVETAIVNLRGQSLVIDELIQRALVLAGLFSDVSGQNFKRVAVPKSNPRTGSTVHARLDDFSRNIIDRRDSLGEQGGPGGDSRGVRLDRRLSLAIHRAASVARTSLAQQSWALRTKTGDQFEGLSMPSTAANFSFASTIPSRTSALDLNLLAVVSREFPTVSASEMFISSFDSSGSHLQRKLTRPSAGPPGLLPPDQLDMRRNAMVSGEVPFWIDFVASVPFVWISAASGLNVEASARFAFVKLLRLYRLKADLDSVGYGRLISNFALYRVIGMIALWIAYLYYQSYVYTLMGNENNETGESETTVVNLWGSVSNAIRDSIANNVPVTSDGKFMTAEMLWVSLFCILAGACLSAACVGSITAFYSNENDSAATKFTKKLDETHAFLSSLPTTLYDKGMRMVAAQYYTQRVFSEEDILAGLNPSLREASLREVALYECRHIVDSIDFLRFDETDPRRSHMFRLLSSGMKYTIYPSNIAVYEQCAVGSSMFMILRGVAVVYVSDLKVGYLSKGSVFGVPNAMLPGPRLEQVETLTQLVCVEVKQSAIERIAASIPEVRDRIRRHQLGHLEALEALSRAVSMFSFQASSSDLRSLHSP
ncbi:anaphase-promoting complex subunit Hcn1, partial [Cladochytrium tenue]